MCKMQNSKLTKKVGIFDPYLDTLGGGERYCLTLAEALLKKGWNVDIFWPEDQNLKQKFTQKFALKIDRVNFIPYSPRGKNLPERFNFERKYDLLFYISDGSVPFMFGKKNFLHFQVPFKNSLKRSFKEQIKLKTIDKVVCNSLFTKNIVDSQLKLDSIVIYPPVDVEQFKPMSKENIILSVARFSQLLQNKKQDVLISSFIRMIRERNLKNWELILAGGSEIGAKEYLVRLKAMAKNYPIKIIENPSFEQLVKLYGKAKIFWSASGYNVDEENEPEKVEHFGISTVEAMAAGCVPIVLGKGGQKEIVESGESGFLWQEKDELIRETVALVSSGDEMEKIARNAILRSKVFSKERFYKEIFAFF